MSGGVRGRRQKPSPTRSYSIGSKLYDDMEWIYEIADIFKKRYDDKVKLVEEIRSNLK